MGVACAVCSICELVMKSVSYRGHKAACPCLSRTNWDQQRHICILHSIISWQITIVHWFRLMSSGLVSFDHCFNDVFMIHWTENSGIVYTVQLKGNTNPYNTYNPLYKTKHTQPHLFFKVLCVLIWRIPNAIAFCGLRAYPGMIVITKRPAVCGCVDTWLLPSFVLVFSFPTCQTPHGFSVK